MEKVSGLLEIINIYLGSNCLCWLVFSDMFFYRCRSRKFVYVDIMKYVGSFFGLFLLLNLCIIRNFFDYYGCLIW